jgi:2,5-diketo-D-gluconate reductase A
MGEVPVVTLNNGVLMPQIGLGTAKVTDEEAGAVVQSALEMGYRSIDTAKDYGNERGVGLGLRAAAIPRDQLFITTKVWNADHGLKEAKAAFEASLERLGLEYLDLYLVHWPVPSQDRYVETWSALEELYSARRVRAIGVSNFEPHHLARLLEHALVTPAVNQVELHPRLQQKELTALHAKLGIATEAWSPFAKGRSVLEPGVVSIAGRRGATPGQVVLRWHLQLGHIVIPKTVSQQRMKENLASVLLGPLDDEELQAFERLDNNGRIGPHPDEFQ